MVSLPIQIAIGLQIAQYRLKRCLVWLRQVLETREICAPSVAGAAQNAASRCVCLRVERVFQARCVVVQVGVSGGARKSFDETMFDQIR